MDALTETVGRAQDVGRVKHEVIITFRVRVARWVCVGRQ